jgi:hypothetical protein
VQQVIQDVLNVPVAHKLEGGSAGRGSSSLDLQETQAMTEPISTSYNCFHSMLARCCTEA